MRRRRITPMMVAGLLVLLSAIGLIALISSGSIQQDISPTDHWYTVDAISRARLTQTAEVRATDLAVTGTAEVTDQVVDPMLQTATNAAETDGTATITPGS